MYNMYITHTYIYINEAYPQDLHWRPPLVVWKTKNQAAYRLAAAAVKLATGDPEEACAGTVNNMTLMVQWIGWIAVV